MAEAASGPRRADFGRWLGQGWEWLVDDLGTFLLIGFFAAVLLAVGNAILAGPVSTGLALTSLRKARGRDLGVGDFFDGFRFPGFIWSLLASLVIGLFVFVGLIFLIVPGLVILAMYLFTFHYIADEERDFWSAMEASRQYVAGDYFGFTLFAFLLSLINLAGLSLAGVGVLLTLPWTALAIAAAHEQTPESVPPAAPEAREEPPQSPVVIE